MNRIQKLKGLLLVCLCFFAYVPNSQAEILRRLMYVTPDYDNNANAKSFLGEYWSLGVVFPSNQGEVSGPSIRYAFGDTGEKLNISYLLGNTSAAWEAGVSYMKQDADATLLVNDKREGYAFEFSLRLSFASIILVQTKKDTSIEVGLGF